MHYNIYDVIYSQLAAEHVGEKIMNKIHHNTVVHFVSYSYIMDLRDTCKTILQK